MSNAVKLVLLALLGIACIIAVLYLIHSADVTTPNAHTKPQPQAQHAGVPNASPYPQLKSFVSRSLTSFDSSLDRLPLRSKKILYGANIPPTVNPNTVFSNKRLIYRYIDRLSHLGVNLVKFYIYYPATVPTVDRDQAQHERFYRDIVAYAHSKGMKVLIGTEWYVAGYQPCGTFGSPQCPTLSAFIEAKTKLALEIVNNIRPDYLTLETEPYTSSFWDDLPALDEPSVFAHVVRSEISAIDKQPRRRNGVLLGAGPATWDNPAHVTLLSRLSLDYIDLHMYQLASTRANFLTAALHEIDTAKEAHKPVIIGETWLQKQLPSEWGRVKDRFQVTKRLYYSFFTSEDEQYLSILKKLSERKGLIGFIPWWTGLFFYNIPYSTKYDSMPMNQFIRIVGRGQNQAVYGSAVTLLGAYYRNLISH